MSPGALRVFPDTNALLAMILFPLDREGRPTLAGEVRALYEAGAFELAEPLSRSTVAFKQPSDSR